jgi:hypothetical protein
MRATIESSSITFEFFSVADGGTLIDTYTISTTAQPPSLTIASASIVEGDTGTADLKFAVQLSRASSVEVSVEVTTADGTAVDVSDYRGQAGRLTFAPGITSLQVAIAILGDEHIEGEEQFFVNLASPNGASIADGQAIGTVFDNDAPPRVTVDDVTLTEGDAATVDAVLQVTLSNATDSSVTVDYMTDDGTALMGSDYLSQSGRITFAPGVTSRTISVPVVGDHSVESTENFFVRLTGAGGATIDDAQARITILDTDHATRTYLLSTVNGGTLVNSNGSSIAVKNADIVQLVIDDTAYSYSLYFDGSDVGLTTSSEDIDAFDILPDGTIIVSTKGAFSAKAAYSSPGSGSGATISGFGEDLFRFTPTSTGNRTTGSWSMFFDGSSAGLGGSAETIDAVAVLEDGRILVSTAGSVAVPGITAKDEDLLTFNPTTRSWSLYFRGSAVGLSASGEDIDAVFVEPAANGGNPTLFFSTRENFMAPGVSGADEDVFRFNPTNLGNSTNGTFASELTLDGSRLGLAKFDIDGLHLGGVSNGFSTSVAAKQVDQAFAELGSIPAAHGSEAEWSGQLEFHSMSGGMTFDGTTTMIPTALAARVTNKDLGDVQANCTEARGNLASIHRILQGVAAMEISQKRRTAVRAPQTSVSSGEPFQAAQLGLMKAQLPLEMLRLCKQLLA